jgi:hypothetical protein
VPNVASIAFSAEWAANVVVNGNLFNQPGRHETAPQPCAVIVTTEKDLPAISGNIVNVTWEVIPPRSNLPPTTSDWKFLNTVY